MEALVVATLTLKGVCRWEYCASTLNTERYICPTRDVLVKVVRTAEKVRPPACQKQQSRPRHMLFLWNGI